ncbi:hypothetical protein SEPCBS119000_006808, partial [Sporothrix epigloea]
MADLPQVTPINSGWAVHTANKEVRQKILNKKASISAQIEAEDIDINTQWLTYMVRNVDRTAGKYFRTEGSLAEAVAEEAFSQTGYRPVQVTETIRSMENVH